MSGQKIVDVDAALEKALSLHKNGVLHEALAAYRAVLDQFPGHPEASQLMGILLLQSGDVPSALRALECAHAAAPDQAHISQNYIEACLLAGEKRRALAVADGFCERSPDLPAAHALRARILTLLGDRCGARAAWQKVLGLDASSVKALMALAADAETRQDWRAAADYYRQLLPLTEQRGAVLCNFGNALLNLGEIAAARSALASAVVESPAEAAAWHNLARASLLDGDLEGGDRAFSEAQSRDPDSLQNAAAWLDMTMKAGDWERAATLLASFLPRFPRDADLLLRSGQVALQRGLPDEAVRCWQQVISMQPRNALARCNLAGLALDRRDLLQARRLCEEAVRIDPGLAEAWLNLALSRHRLDDLPGAMNAYRKAAALCGKAAGREALARTAHLNLARALMDTGDFPSALPLLVAAGAEESREPEAFGNLVDALLRVADWSHLELVLGKAMQADGERWVARLNPFTVLALTDDPLAQQSAARAYAQRTLRDAQPWRPHPGGPSARPLRIGYLSADLHGHATAYLAADLFESHDRARFRTYAYSTGPDDGSPMRRRMLSAFDVFRELRGRSVGEIQQLIREDRIDILVDLKGYTFRAMPEVLVGRPAPLQISFLGYPGSLGSVAVDYVVADAGVIPEAAIAGFDECPLFLPVCYQPQDRYWQVGAVGRRGDHGLPENGPVLACFNQVYKLRAEVFDDWLQILQAVPAAVLWLIEPGAVARANLLARAEACGIAARRLIFAPLVAHPEHLARIGFADLVLDTFPCGAHTTASDALRRGVPVVTRRGRSFASRVAASLLEHAGLPELVSDSRFDYVRLATELALDAPKRESMRLRLIEALPRLVDTSAYMRAYETALETVWARHCQQLPPLPQRIAGSAGV